MSDIDIAETGRAMKLARQAKRASAKAANTNAPCEVCGDVNSQGHHEDYSRPLEVMWLCQKHHSARHMEMERIDEQTLQLQARG